MNTNQTMIPKDILPLIGRYLKPELFVLCITTGGRRSTEHVFYIHANSEDNAYAKIAETAELAYKVMSILQVCVMGEYDSQKYYTALYARIDERLYIHGLDKEDADRYNRITLKNTFTIPLTPKEIHSLLTSVVPLKQYHGDAFKITFKKVKVY